MKSLGIYIHIPFCEHKCPYCDFVSYDGKSALMASYTECLVRQIMEYAPFTRGYSVNTVYIGGGTPTCLDGRLLSKLLTAIKKGFTLADGVEFTCEANPHSALADKLKILRRGGVNRLSLGLQSAQSEELKVLGRIHTYEDFVSSFKAARQEGFDNINVDLMFAVPGQTMASMEDTLSKVISLSPEHVSAYSLTINENTPYYAMRDTLPLSDEELDRDLYKLTIDTLEAHGYEQYEISNFAKPGRRSRHNLRYWNCEEYIGLGCSAHSYFSGKRFAFLPDIDKYIDAVKNGRAIVSEVMDIAPNEMVGEYIMLRFRLRDGIDVADFDRLFGFSFETAFAPQIEKYMKSGHLKKSCGRYSLTLEGMNISNYIISDFLEY